MAKKVWVLFTPHQIKVLKEVVMDISNRQAREDITRALQEGEKSFKRRICKE